VTAVDSIVTLVIGDDGILVMERLRRVIELKKKKKKKGGAGGRPGVKKKKD